MTDALPVDADTLLHQQRTEADIHLEAALAARAAQACDAADAPRPPVSATERRLVGLVVLTTTCAVASAIAAVLP